MKYVLCFFFSSRRRHTRSSTVSWASEMCIRDRLRTTITKAYLINEIIDFKNSKIFKDPTVFVGIVMLTKCSTNKFPYFYEFKISNDNFSKLTKNIVQINSCLLYTSPSPRDRTRSRMPSSAWKKNNSKHKIRHLILIQQLMLHNMSYKYV